MYYNKVLNMSKYEFEDYISDLTISNIEDIMNYISYEIIECSGDKYRNLIVKLNIAEYVLDKMEINNEKSA